MKKSEMAEAMLELLHDRRPDEIAVICEVTITYRNHVIRSREHSLSSNIFTQKEADAIMLIGELTDEIFPLLLKDDLLGVEALLKTYAS